MEGSRGVSRGVGLEQKSPYFMIKNPFIQRKIFLINKKNPYNRCFSQNYRSFA